MQAIVRREDLLTFRPPVYGNYNHIHTFTLCGLPGDEVVALDIRARFYRVQAIAIRISPARRYRDAYLEDIEKSFRPSPPELKDFPCFRH